MLQKARPKIILGMLKKAVEEILLSFPLKNFFRREKKELKRKKRKGGERRGEGKELFHCLLEAKY